MNKKHLWWIIPASILVGLIITVLFYKFGIFKWMNMFAWDMLGDCTNALEQCNCTKVTEWVSNPPMVMIK